MQRSRFLVLCASVVGASGLLLMKSPEGSGRTPCAPRSDECEEAADALLNVNINEANADYWIAIANCLNDDDDFDDCEEAASDALQEALALAQEQFDARVDACALLGGGPYDPDLDEEDFSTTIDNSYLPFKPGRTLIYEKQTADGLETVKVKTLKENGIVEIDGFSCRAVQDTVDLNGQLVEDTTDWYAQDEDGTVWYFGELAKNYDEDGFLDNLDGSWRTGRQNAKPGIVMKAHPAVGDFYRQEFFVNEAEDLARVVALDETVTVPYGTFKHCIQIEESAPLEPGHVTQKFYAAGTGLVLEVSADGTRTELVKIKK